MCVAKNCVRAFKGERKADESATLRAHISKRYAGVRGVGQVWPDYVSNFKVTASSGAMLGPSAESHV